MVLITRCSPDKRHSFQSWYRVTHKVFGYCLCTTLVSVGSLSASHAQNGQAEEEIEIPDLEVLEFLGSFATDEGEWIDPQSLLEEDITSLLDMADRLAEQERNNDADTQAGNND